MERNKQGVRDDIGSVEAVINLYGQKLNVQKKKDLNMGKLKETEKSGEKEKATTETELFKAKGAAKELALQIERYNGKAKAEKKELLLSRQVDRDDQNYHELMRELNNMKQELTRLKFDVATALESKAEAQKMIEYSNSRAKFFLSSAEELKKEMEEVDEEHVFVELARIEAQKEYREIEAQRKDEAAQFSKEIEAAREKVKFLQNEVSQAKDLELKLAATSSEISTLQSDMQLVRATENSNRLETETAEAELKAAKTELRTILEEGVQFLASMDIIRKELVHITKEMEQLKDQETKADSIIQQLNSELRKAKEKLDSATAAQQKSKLIVSSLSDALQRTRQETETVRNKKELISEETRRTKSRIELIETKILSGEERLQAAVLELEAFKASEATALKQLREVAHRTFRNRKLSPRQTSTVIISKSEYEYLFKTAESAQVVAEKKVAAARAWVAAVKAEEAEIVMKTELVEREIKELEIAEQRERDKLQNTLADQKIAMENGEVRAEEAEYLSVAPPRRGVRDNRAPTSSIRRTSMRRSSIALGKKNNARSPSVPIKKQ